MEVEKVLLSVQCWCLWRIGYGTLILAHSTSWQFIQNLLRILNSLYFVSVPSSVTHSIFSFLHFLFSRRSCVGERHSPSPSVRIRFSVFVEDSKASAAAAANFGGLVLCCMDSYDSEQRHILQHFSRSTRLSKWISAFCNLSIPLHRFLYQILYFISFWSKLHKITMI